MNGTKAIVFFAGSRWDEIPGTDVNLALALSDSCPVVWVDPAVPATWYLRSRTRPPAHVTAINDNLVRFSVIGLPASSKPVSRDLTRALLHRRLRSYLRASHTEPLAVVVASPTVTFPQRIRGTKAYVVTDNWVAGAEMMGIDRGRITEVMRRNLEAADVVTAVTPALIETLTTLRPGIDVRLIPNGCSPELYAQECERPVGIADGPYAVLAGQINERIDIAALRAVADTGSNLVLVGPRTESDPECTAALDQLLAHPNVSWVGSKSRSEAASYIAHAAVGLTPYEINEFNSQSFPLKTLDYLAAGIPVASTDLPATRWLATDLVAVTGTAHEFGKVADNFCRNPAIGSVASRERRELAATHSWAVRADALRQLLNNSSNRQSGNDMDSKTTGRLRIDHALLTRFNLPSEGREQRIRLEDGWLTERWELFTRFCAPSVARQTNQSFSWIIYFDPETPPWLREKVSVLSAGGLFTPIYRSSVSHAELFADIADATGVKGDVLITTNLDNDDGLANDFVERVQAAPPDRRRYAIYLTNGLIRREGKLYRRTDRHNAFCSVSETWEEPRGCWATWHNLLAKELPVIEVGGEPGWLQVVHGRNVSNRVRGRLTSPVNFRLRFPELLEDVTVPTRSQRLYDLSVQRSSRTAYEAARSATKSAAVAAFGAEGMAQTRNRAEEQLTKVRALKRFRREQTASAATSGFDQETN